MEREKIQELERMLETVVSWGFEPPAEALGKLIGYHDLIVEKNEAAGLVSPKDLDRLIPRHFLESVALARQVSFHPALLVMDFGCGAGLPSIPIKILFPEFPLYLIESKRKKALFLEKAVSEVGLEHVTVIADRGEELHKYPEFRGIFDVVLARTVSALERVVSWCLPFISEQGRIIIPGSPAQDLRMIEESFGVWGGIHQIRISNEEIPIKGSRKEIEALELRRIRREPNLIFGDHRNS